MRASAAAESSGAGVSLDVGGAWAVCARGSDDDEEAEDGFAGVAECSDWPVVKVPGPPDTGLARMAVVAEDGKAPQYWL